MAVKMKTMTDEATFSGKYSKMTSLTGEVCYGGKSKKHTSDKWTARPRDLTTLLNVYDFSSSTIILSPMWIAQRHLGLKTKTTHDTCYQI